LIILSGHSDPREVSKLNGKRNRFENLCRTLKPSSLATLNPEDRWLEEEDRRLQEEAEKARQGMSFYKMR
jgi:RNA exonuclease 1